MQARRPLRTLRRPRPQALTFRAGLGAALLASVLLAVTAAPALAWDARTIEGTEAERRNTTTQLPPDGDQCSLGAPDMIPLLYEFSWACYAHDVCYQNHQLNGVVRTRRRCDDIMLAKMHAECDSRHSWYNPNRHVCRRAGDAYYGVVRAVGLTAWLSWNGVPD